MKQDYKRRDFIRTAAIAGMGITLTGTSLYGFPKPAAGKRVGIIGLDTSHSIAFTKALNAAEAEAGLGGYKVVAAYPKGSNDIESSVTRIPGYTEDIRKLGVEITGSIDELLKKTDVILLETNDGRLHYEQAMQVFKAGKPVFIDKPVSASLSDAIKIFDAAKKYGVPVFTSSSLRYAYSVQDVVKGKIGEVLGADAFSPATLEKTHPDLYWYGIHGVETLCTVMGTGCKSVVRIGNRDTDVVVGTWADGRIGTFRGTRSGTHSYGGTVYGSKGNATLNSAGGYQPLLLQIVEFFNTGKPPVSAEETLEIFAFMDAADESKAKGGASIALEDMMERARKI